MGSIFCVFFRRFPKKPENPNFVIFFFPVSCSTMLFFFYKRVFIKFYKNAKKSSKITIFCMSKTRQKNIDFFDTFFIKKVIYPLKSMIL